MSIKGFHLIFIGIASLFCVGFGVWALFLEGRGTSLGVTLAGGFSFLTAVGLLVYGVCFYRKSKNIIV